MNYLILFLLVIISVEIVIKFKYIFLLNSLVLLIKKSSKLILNPKVSDHWKEKIVPGYSFKMIQYSLFMLFIFSSIIFLFFLAATFSEYFLELIFSFKGIISSTLLAFSYAYIRKILKK